MKKIFTIILLFTMSLNLAGSNSFKITNNIPKQNTLMLASGVSPFEVLKSLEEKGCDLSKDKNLREYIKENIFEYLKKERISKYAIEKYKAQIEKAESVNKNLYEIYEIVKNHLQARKLFKEEKIEIDETCFFNKITRHKTNKGYEEKIIIEKRRVGDKIEIYDLISGRKLGELDLIELGIKKDTVSISLVGDQIFVKYKSNKNDWRLYNLSKGKEVKIEEAIGFENPVLAGDQIFVRYETKKVWRLYNLSKGKEVKIEGANYFKNPVLAGNQIFVAYHYDLMGKYLSSLYNLSKGKEVKIKGAILVDPVLVGDEIFVRYRDYNRNWRLYNLSKGKEVKIEGASDFEDPVLVGNEIFVRYQTNEGWRLYNLSKGKEVKIEGASDFEDPVLVGDQQFVRYKTKEGWGLYNLSKGKEVKIKGATYFEDPVFVGNEIFVRYKIKEDWRLYNISQKKKVEVSNYEIITTSKYIEPKPINKVNIKILKQHIPKIKKNSNNISLQYLRANYVSNMLNISNYPSLSNMLEDPNNTSLADYFCKYLTSDELKILDKIISESNFKNLNFLSHNLDNSDQANKIKAILKIKEESERKHKKYIMNIYKQICLAKLRQSIRDKVSNDVINTIIFRFFSGSVTNDFSKVDILFKKYLDSAEYSKYFNLNLVSDEDVNLLLTNASVSQDDIFASIKKVINKALIKKYRIKKIINRWQEIYENKKTRTFYKKNLKINGVIRSIKFMLEEKVIIIDFDKLGLDTTTIWKALINAKWISKNGVIQEEIKKLKNKKNVKLENFTKKQTRKIISILRQPRIIIKNETEWINLLKAIDSLKVYLEKELGGQISYRDVIAQFPNLKNIISKKQKTKKSLLKILKKNPLLMEKDKREKLKEVFRDGPLYRKYKKGKRITFVMPPLLEELDFKNWQIFRKQIKNIFPDISVNKIMRLVQKFFKNVKNLSKEGLSVDTNWRMACSV
ncbi:hypothetical protein ACFL5N_01150 [bacterium]